ncbi:MAG TPA: hypothetical protein VGV59_04150 [Pyrinomonadaceae bacterium]|nr:hypothetical protein [Pyrinomonadaceae bacterium]
MHRFRTFLFLTLTLALLLASPLLYRSSLADNGPQHRVSSNSFGVSGGNVNDRSRSFCCSGTLGSLVQDSAGTRYILSNNHVMARSDAAAIGEDISQPGMIDVNCQIAEIVADLSAYPSVRTSGVDAAIAQLRPNAMDASGTILDIGTISSIVLPPVIGLPVQKSGRTTGHTTGSVSSINTSVSIQYQQGCGGGKKFTGSFTNQVVINSSTFSAGGDSGSLIVSSGACPQPVALLFAGSSTTTIGNPIGTVLSRVSTALGREVSFVGTACGTTTSSTSSTSASDEGGIMSRVPQVAVDRARGVKEANERVLMALPSVIGVGIGDAGNGDAAIVIYVDRTTGVRPVLPRNLEGVAVREILTDPFVAR